MKLNRFIKQFTLTAFLIALLLSLLYMTANTNPDAGFRGVDWGTSVDDIDGSLALELVSSKGNNFEIYSTSITAINDIDVLCFFAFYDKSFCGVYIFVKNNGDKFFNTLTKSYGLPNKGNGYGLYYWDNEYTIKEYQMLPGNRGTLMIGARKILQHLQ